jgi:hypothetical protein
MLQPDRQARGDAVPSEDSDAKAARSWRRALRRELAWILVLKFAALTLLWALFFRGPHASLLDAGALSERLGLHGAAHPAAPRESPHD